jgi:hypothetical protein
MAGSAPSAEVLLTVKDFAAIAQKTITNHSLPGVPLRFQLLHFGDGILSPRPLASPSGTKRLGVRA